MRSRRSCINPINLCIYFIIGATANLQINSSATNDINHKREETSKTHNQDQRTEFDCSGKANGYYADLDTNCQVFHYCQWNSKKSTFTCPRGFQFSEEQEMCILQGSQCNELKMATTTDSTIERQLRDQIPATSPPTTSVSLHADQSVDESHRVIRRVSRHVPLWLSPSPVQLNPGFQLLPGLSAQRREDHIVHLLVPPEMSQNPTQQLQAQTQQQLFQVIADPSLPVSLNQGGTSVEDLTSAQTVNVLGRQGQMHHRQPSRSFAPPPSPSTQRGFSGHQLQLSPQFFVEDTRDQRFFDLGPHRHQQPFSPLDSGSRRNPFLTTSSQPQFSSIDSFIGDTFPSPPDDLGTSERPQSQGSRHPQRSNFIINPEDLTLINEIIFPGPPSIEVANQPPARSQQRRPTSSTSQDFQPNRQSQVNFPHRFPAESPGFHDFNNRRPTFQHHVNIHPAPAPPPPPPPPPPPSFFTSQQFSPPSPSTFQLMSNQRPTTSLISTEIEQPPPPPPPSIGSNENNQFSISPIGVNSNNNDSPGSVEMTPMRGPSRFQQQVHHGNLNNDDRDFERFRGPPAPLSSKRPIFDDFESSTPQKDSTEEFGIPPPTDDFGIKLGGSNEEGRTRRPLMVTSTGRNFPSRSRRPLAPPPPPPQFFSAGSPVPFLASDEGQNQQSNFRQNNRDRDQETSTEPIRSTETSSSDEFFGPSTVSDESNQSDGPNFFRPTSNSNGDDFSAPFIGQTIETNSNENSANNQRNPNNGNRLPIEEDDRRPFRDFDSFQDSHQHDGFQDGNFGEFPTGPTFGPQSVDQLAPPDLPPFTTKPETTEPSSDNENGSPKSKIITSKPVVTSDPSSSSTESEKATDSPATIPPLRVRSRTRRPPPTTASTTTASTTTIEEDGTKPKGRNRNSATTTSKSPSSSSLRRRKPFFSRKTTASPIVSSAELNDVTSSSGSSSTVSTTKRRPVLVRKMISTKGNTTRILMRRRRPFGSTTKGPGTATSGERFASSVSHHASGISRDQLVSTNRNKHRSKTVTTKPDGSVSLDALESQEHLIVAEISDGELSESGVREHITPDEDSIELKRDPSRNTSSKNASIKSSNKSNSTIKGPSTSTNTTNLKDSLNKGRQGTSSTITTSINMTESTSATIASKTTEPTEIVNSTSEATTISTPSATEKPVDEDDDGQPEAMAKLRSLLNRKYIIKQTTEKPE